MTRRPMPAWALFAVPAAFVLVLGAAFAAGGPVLGFLVAGIAAVGTMTLAIRSSPEPEPAGQGATPVPAAVLIGAAAVLGVALVAAGGEALTFVGAALVGVALITALAIVFLAIGHSGGGPAHRPPSAPHDPPPARG